MHSIPTWSQFDYISGWCYHGWGELFMARYEASGGWSFLGEYQLSVIYIFLCPFKMSRDCRNGKGPCQVSFSLMGKETPWSSGQNLEHYGVKDLTRSSNWIWSAVGRKGEGIHWFSTSYIYVMTLVVTVL